MPSKQIDAHSLYEVALRLLDQATAMKLRLRAGDVDYDINFIQTKLGVAGVYMERLSDIQMKLTRMSIDTHKMIERAKFACHQRDAQLKLSTSYQTLKRTEKGPWLQQQLVRERGELDSWISLSRALTQVCEAVTARAQTMNRIDSQLRTHAKLFEHGVRAGATSATAYTGADLDRIDVGRP